MLFSSSHLLSLANAGRPCILCEYSYAELQLAEGGNRIVTYNEHWIAVVPWWAAWPFETLCKKYFNGSVEDYSHFRNK